MAQLSDVPRAARILGFAGLIPFAFFALAALLADDPWAGAAQRILAQYGAVILAFMGGCRWGFAAAGMGDGPEMTPLLMAVLPAIWAWVALSAPGAFGLVILAAGLGALLLGDLTLTRTGGAPAWWPALRWPLTAGASGALLLGALA